MDILKKYKKSYDFQEEDGRRDEERGGGRGDGYKRKVRGSTKRAKGRKELVERSRTKEGAEKTLIKSILRQ